MTFKEFLDINNMTTTFFDYSPGGPLEEFYNAYTNISSNNDFDNIILAFKSRFLNRTLIQDYDPIHFLDDFNVCVTDFNIHEPFLKFAMASVTGKIVNGKYKKEETTLTNNLTTEITGLRTLVNNISQSNEQKEYHAPANILSLDDTNIKGGNKGTETADKTETQNDDNTQSTTQTTTNSIEVYGELTAHEIELIKDYSKKFLSRCLNYFEPLFIGVF